MCFAIEDIAHSNLKLKDSLNNKSIERLDGLTGRDLNLKTHNLSYLIATFAFIDENLNLTYLDQKQLNELELNKKLKNLNFDIFIFQTYKCFNFHLVYKKINRYEIRMEDMLYVTFQNNNFDFYIAIHQQNDYSVKKLHPIPKGTNIDIKYRQWFHVNDVSIFELIRNYEYQNHSFTDQDNFLKEIKDFNQSITFIPLFSPNFDFQINNSYFNGYNPTSSNYRLSQRIELGKSINITYDVLLNIMNLSNCDIR